MQMPEEIRRRQGFGDKGRNELRRWWLASNSNVLQQLKFGVQYHFWVVAGHMNWMPVNIVGVRFCLCHQNLVSDEFLRAFACFKSFSTHIPWYSLSAVDHPTLDFYFLVYFYWCLSYCCSPLDCGTMSFHVMMWDDMWSHMKNMA